MDFIAKVYFCYKRSGRRIAPACRIARWPLKRLSILVVTLSLAPPAWSGEGSAHSPPAGEGGIAFSLDQRLRGEWRENNFDFDDSADALTDDAWLLSRTRLGVEWTPASWLRVAVQGQDTREFLSARPNVLGQLGAEGDDSFDLRQGYVEIGDPKHGLSAKLGRQTLIYGDKRLISSGEWGNASRAFDAARLHFEQPKWWLDAFAASVVRFSDGEFNRSDWLDESDALNQTLSGLYFSTTAIAIQATDLYALHLRDDAGTGFVTLGARMKGDPAKLGGWEYATEMAVQLGDLKDKNLTAFAGHWDLGYNWLRSPWRPRLALEYSFASGDSNAADGDAGTFQNLFPTNHLNYGYMDLFAWQNLHNPAVHFSVQPHERVKLAADFHAFWLANTNDSWYRASIISTARPITPSAGGYAGCEIDFTVQWKALKHLDVQAGYSRFFAGDYLQTSGANDDADFAYVMTTISF